MTHPDFMELTIVVFFSCSPFILYMPEICSVLITYLKIYTGLQPFQNTSQHSNNRKDWMDPVKKLIFLFAEQVERQRYYYIFGNTKKIWP